MADPVIPPVEEPKPFDYAAHKAAANAADEAKRTGKPIVPPLAAPTEVKPAEPKGDDGIPLPKSVRRTMSELRDRAARAEGRAETLQELIDKGVISGDRSAPKPVAVPTDSDPEPQEYQFAKLANGQPNPNAERDYQRAMGRWDSRQEARKEVGKVSEQTAQTEEQEQIADHFRAMGSKAEEDRKLYPDWADVVKSIGDEDMSLDGHHTLNGLLGSSDMQAAVLYHWAKNPAEFRELRDLVDPEKQPKRKDFKSEEAYDSALGRWAAPQIKAFNELVGYLRHTSKKAPDPKKEDKPKPTAVERDAALAPPASSVAPRGGAPTNGDIPMLLSDGKTLNPAWKAMRNAASGRRP